MLAAARRLGTGDFSKPVPTEGHDEFAQLGHEFNAMAGELEGRIAELARQRTRLQESIRRIGQTFAANLDRDTCSSSSPRPRSTRRRPRSAG